MIKGRDAADPQRLRDLEPELNELLLASLYPSELG
jgi:hypothetical protein